MKEFHVKEPLHIIFNSMKEMSEFCKSVELWRLQIKHFLRLFTTLSHYSIIAGSYECYIVIVAGCPRKWSEDFMISSSDFLSCLS